jgi:hypothetical protein
MRERVSVNRRIWDGFGMRAWLTLDHNRIVEEWGSGGSLGELGGELTEGEMLTAAIDESEGGDIPKDGGPTVTEHDFVTIGEGEELGEPVAKAAHHEFDRLLTMAGAEIVEASGCERGDGFRANLRRAATEAAVNGE